MPLYLRPPRQGKSASYEIRGTYLGHRVEQSSGTAKRSVAETELRKIERAIEDGTWGKSPATGGGPTFLSDANAYLEAGGRKKYIAALIKHFGEMPRAEYMKQEVIDAAATKLHPNVTPATRNCYVYTPVSAILHHALGEKSNRALIRRPAGAKGRELKHFMWPEDVFAIIREADKIDAEFGLYLRILLFTGMRKGEGLGLLASDVRVKERVAWLHKTKNEDPRMVRLCDALLSLLEDHLKNHDGTRLIRFSNGGHLWHLLTRAKLAAVGLPCPKRRPKGWTTPKHRLSFVGFHVFRHTFATWFRMDAGGDVQGLVETGNWRDVKSAARYAHVVARQEWDRVAHFPTSASVAKKKRAS